MSISIVANSETVGSGSNISGVVHINTSKDEPQFRSLKVELIGREKTEIKRTVTCPDHTSQTGGTKTKTETKKETHKFLERAQHLSVGNIKIDNHTVNPSF